MHLKPVVGARRSRAVSCALAALVMLSASAASAQSAPNVPGVAFGAPAGEAILAVGAIAVNATTKLPQRITDWAPDAARPYDRTADRISDVTGAYGGAVLSLGGGYALEAAYFGEAGVQSGGVYALRSLLVDLEAALYTRGVVDALKRITGRCRPRHYVTGTCDTDVRDAFPSGHVAPMAALASTRLYLAAQSTGPFGYRWTSYAATETLALATAYLRVRAGAHSWTDVLGGFLIGHTIGLLVAVAHPITPVSPHDWPPTPEPTTSEGFALTWSGGF